MEELIAAYPSLAVVIETKQGAAMIPPAERVTITRSIQERGALSGRKIPSGSKTDFLTLEHADALRRRRARWKSLQLWIL